MALPSSNHALDLEANLTGHLAGNSTTTFNADPMTLAWLENFASSREPDNASFAYIEGIFPWLWDPTWGDAVGIGIGEVRKLKNVVQQAESMVNSLETFLRYSKDRLGRLRGSLKAVATKSFFPSLSDDILALIFEFASLPRTRSYIRASDNENDIKTPSRISQVSRRFRKHRVKLPLLWRFLDARSHSWSDVQLLASRSAHAGPILEVHVESKITDQDRRIEALYDFFCHIITLSSQITVLRLDLCPLIEDDLLRKFHELGEYASLSLPSLQELVLKISGATNATNVFSDVHFYENWELPALMVLRARNIIPNLRSRTVLAGVFECSLSIDEGHDVYWEFSQIIGFLSSLTGVQILNVFLDGHAVPPDFDFAQDISLPTVEHLITSFPSMHPMTAKSFCSAVQTPNKKRWTLEVEVEQSLQWPMLNLMWFVFPEYDDSQDPTRMPDDDPNCNLKEIDIVIPDEFGMESWEEVRKMARAAQNLDRLSISYPVIQRRKIGLKNCRGRIEELVDTLKDKVDRELGIENFLVVDGYDAQELGDRDESDRRLS